MDGQPHGMLNTARALGEFGFKAKTDFRKGLRKTISWYDPDSPSKKVKNLVDPVKTG